LFESVYESALCYELDKAGLDYKRQLNYQFVTKYFGCCFRIDILVENKDSVNLNGGIDKVHYKQIITYLKLTTIPLGLLVNFNMTL
jgi:GxxExxY protein